jgi:hypothetical protein
MQELIFIKDRLVKGRGRGLPATLFVISCAVRNIELSLHFRDHTIWNDALVYCHAMRIVRPTFELDLRASKHQITNRDRELTRGEQQRTAANLGLGEQQTPSW